MKHNRLMNTLNLREGAVFEAGEGIELIDAQTGKRYVDFFCDVGTSSLGYASSHQKAVLERMLEDNIPCHAPNLYLHAERDRAAERLCQITEMDKLFFCNSGAESAEAAVKLARLYHHTRHANRYVIATYKGGFHGRTIAMLAAGDGPKYHSEGFGPFPEGFMHFTEIEQIPKDAAAIMIAPVFGNNDVIEYPEGWLYDLRKYATQHGILLIFDEVQTGAGRAGTWYTYAQKVGVRPDILTLGKGVAMGVPTGVCLARGPVADTFTPGTHFSTFGGNPICCAFVNGMIDWAEGGFEWFNDEGSRLKSNLVQVDRMGIQLRAALARHSWAKNVRGVGLLCAFDLEGDTLDFSKRCFAEGLLVGAFRAGPGVVKVTPPLNVTPVDIEAGVEIMDKVIMDKLLRG